MWRKALVLILATVSVGGMFIQPAQGKEYPTKTIEIFVPYGPGSPMDLISRLVADRAQKYLGQPLVVVNKTGAGGSIAAAEVISSKPDGYKVINLTSAFFTLTTKTQNIPFDPGHLTPIACVSHFKGGICVRGDSPFKTLNDLVDYAKKNPGELRWAHSGRGTAEHVAMLFIFRKMGVQTIDVATKGTPEKVVAILGGHVPVSFMGWGAVKEHVKAGKVRFLMVMSDQRYSDAPDVPSSTELGFPELAKITIYVGYYVHKDTPDEIKKILFDAFSKTCEEPELKMGIEKIGDVPRCGGPEFLNEVLKMGEEINIPILKEMGLYIGR